MNKKNLRRVSIVVTAQTLWNLYRMAAMAGYGEKDVGRVIDKLVREKCAAEKQTQERAERKGG